jgi:hypothetical protein
MNILITILLVLAGIIALVLIIGLFTKKEHYVKREIIINAPQQKVFDYAKLLKNEDEWNKNEKTDPNKKQEFRGKDGTVGFIIAFSGNKNVGVGEKEIMNIVEEKRIEIEMRFVKPMTFTATLIMDTVSLSDNQTKVSLSHDGILKYPKNIMILMFEKMFAKQMDISLTNLKNILENVNRQ